MKCLDHTHIIKLYDVYNTSTRVVLNTEYCGKINIQDYLERHNNILSLPTTRKIITSLIKAMAYLHSQNISHRDIKLENALINEDGVIKIIDFGFAVKNMTPSEYITNFCGTPTYMSPEIVKRKPYKGDKADIWALGVLLYKISTGDFPFKGNSEDELFAAIVNDEPYLGGNVSREIKSFLTRMLSKHPDCRPSAKDLLSHEWLVTS